MGERLIDQILRDRAKAGLVEAKYDVDHVTKVHPPEDTGQPIEVWFVTKDGHGDWAYMQEVTVGAKHRLKVIPDP